MSRSNVIWFQHINTIGGVESVMWNVVRKYKDYDITIWYNSGDPFQIARLSHYVELVKFNPDEVMECDNLIINYNYRMIGGKYRAKKVVFMIHADYKYQMEHGNLPEAVTDPTFEYYAVSKWAADRYEEITGIKPKVCYNPITIDDERKALLIVSATRIQQDKGKLMWRMKTFADRLTERNIPFIWMVFTNSNEKIDHPNVISIGSRIDILPYLRKADYVAQLSDSEAFCMTILESVTMNKPVIVTDIPSFREMGINEEKGLILKHDMSNMDECIDHIYDKHEFDYTPNEDIWSEILTKTKRKRELKPMKRYRVRATDKFTLHWVAERDTGKIYTEGETFEVNADRLPVLLGENPYNEKFIDVIEEVTNQSQKEDKCQPKHNPKSLNGTSSEKVNEQAQNKQEKQELHQVLQEEKRNSSKKKSSKG